MTAHNKIIYLISIIILCISQDVFSTAQASEKLIYKGIEYSLYSNPLEGYFYRHPDKRPDIQSNISCLWRGYIATYEIEEKKLKLKDIETLSYEYDEDGKSQAKYKSILDDVFPGDEHDTLTWDNQILTLINGEQVEYVHMGYASTYSDYILLVVENSEITYEVELTLKQFLTFKDMSFEMTEKIYNLKNKIEFKLKNENISLEFLTEYFVEFNFEHWKYLLNEISKRE